MNKNCFDLQQPLITNLIDFDLFMIEKKIKRIYLKFLSVLSLLYHLFDSAQRSMKEITDFRLLLFSKKKKKKKKKRKKEKKMNHFPEQRKLIVEGPLEKFFEKS